MKKEKEDLSVKEVAAKNMNQTVITGMFVMNLILTVAYAVEVVKQARTLGSYLVVAGLCVLPCIFSLIFFFKKKNFWLRIN